MGYLAIEGTLPVSDFARGDILSAGVGGPQKLEWMKAVRTR
jgi:hypothetical protein